MGLNIGGSTKNVQGDQSYTRIDSGPYFAIVKENVDPTKMGRLKVVIPALSGVDNVTKGELISCEYLPPFYGAKSPDAIRPSKITEFQSTQHAYGMWMVPPDIDSQVLVIFAEGKITQGFWMGCVQQPYINHMVPGIASSTDTFAEDDRGKESTYGTNNVPAGETNRALFSDTNNSARLDRLPKPVHPFARTLQDQGLIQDTTRGTTSSSARRETPSNVFGISTPGKIDARNPKKDKLGATNDLKNVQTTRLAGHTFVMDDGDAVGNNQLTRLRTATGHQILMHDTDGSIYIANGSGNAWIEMQSNGRIDLYSGIGGINFRTEGDMNFHSDLNMNFHANKQVRMSSANEMIHSADSMLNIGEKAILNSSPKGSIRDYSRDGISSFTDGTQLHGSVGQFHLAGAQVHFNSTNASDLWGPKWLNKDKVGMQLREEGDVELSNKGIRPLESFTKKTKTTVHRFVTHEPMFRASVIGNDGIIPIDSDDKKAWSKLSRTPGTAEFINMQNRINENSSIRDAQYQADALEYVKQKMGKSTNAVKAKKLLTDFGQKYNDIYGITKKVNLPFDIKDSISEKLKGINFNTSSKDLTKTLTTQVIDNFTGKSTALFKDNVFVNSSGELFSIGNSISGMTGNIDILNTSLNAVDGLVGNLSSIKNIESSLANFNSITQTYSNVVGGNIVGLNQVKKLATKTGLFNAREAAISGQGFLQNVGANLSTKIGSIASSVGKFFSGGGFKFSDVRLKEQIRFVGKSPAGINIYSFKYKQLPGRYIGVMAQEVPWARRMTDTGYYAVDYTKVDVKFRRLQ